MDKTRILSGELLVFKGALKINSSLPEVGLKDVIPNGSWLEQKQTQAALEARKQLIGLERIEKSGVLSHAEWIEELMLAKVTQKVGGHWQYIGHNIGKQLYLNPEEALFLMEVNGLLLKHNEVKISLQQAYALLLRNKKARIKYKVYASLSRLGYKVYRHQAKQEPVEREQSVDTSHISKVDTDKMESDCDTQNENNCEAASTSNHNSCHGSENGNSNKEEETITIIPMDVSDRQKQNDCKDQKCNIETDQATLSRQPEKTHTNFSKLESSNYIKHKINNLKSRNLKALKADLLHSGFEIVPDFTKNRIVTMKPADKRYAPRLVVPGNRRYILDIDKIRTTSTTSEENSTTSSPSTSAMYGSYERNTSSNINYTSSWTDFNFRFTPQPNPFRYFNYWRPQTNFNYFHLNMTFQRPFQYPQFGPRIIMNPPLQPFFVHNVNESLNFSINDSVLIRKRIREQSKKEHLDLIYKLATLVTRPIIELRASDRNIYRLKQLIQLYNAKYKKRLRLSDDFEVINDENIIETIELDEEGEQTSKRFRKDEGTVAFDIKLQKLNQLTIQLKNLKANHGIRSQHRRMFSRLLRTFNNFYNVDYYVDDNFEIVNSNDLTINSLSSDTETISEANPTPSTSKKLKNPFSILKQLSDRQTEEEPRAYTSNYEVAIVQPDYKYSKTLVQTFKNGWLPDVTNFGRPEIISSSFAGDFVDTRKEELIFDFIKIQPDKFNNWLDIKISFLQCLQKTSELFNYGAIQKKCRLNSLIKLEDFNNAASVLKKLNIFQKNQTIRGDTNLVIDFDVYSRDVQNFKKSNRPRPHFRVVCLRESSTMPSAADIASLHSKYKDNVTVMFAVIGTGSISYLQANSVDLPVYISSNNNTV